MATVVAREDPATPSLELRRVASFRLRSGKWRLAGCTLTLTEDALLEPRERVFRLEAQPWEEGAFTGELLGLRFEGRTQKGATLLQSRPRGSWLRIEPTQPWAGNLSARVMRAPLAWRLLGQRGTGHMRLLRSDFGEFPVAPVDGFRRTDMPVPLPSVLELDPIQEPGNLWYTAPALLLAPTGEELGVLGINVAMIEAGWPAGGATLLRGGALELQQNPSIGLSDDTIADLLATPRTSRRDAFFDVCAERFSAAILRGYDPYGNLGLGFDLACQKSVAARFPLGCYSWGTHRRVRRTPGFWSSVGLRRRHPRIPRSAFAVAEGV